MTRAQSIPANGPGRRALQEKGQFWTPAWVAEAMARFVLAGRPNRILDPAVGAGAFFRAARELGYAGALEGFESDPHALEQAAAAGMEAADLAQVRVADFLAHPPELRMGGVIANPPYIRHHRIAPILKSALRLETQRRGIVLDGRAGLHVYFFLRCLDWLAPGGRLAFIVSADLCEGVFAGRLWAWVAARYRLHAVATFAPQAAPFPGVDTNAIVIALERAAPQRTLTWTRVDAPTADALGRALGEGQAGGHTQRDLTEALATGLSRPPLAQGTQRPLLLGDIARVMRGIATGANAYFFMTRARRESLGLASEWFLRAIGRTRDCRGDALTLQDLDALDAAGRPTWLLSLPPVQAETFPPTVAAYLALGVRQNLPGHPLIAARRYWYSVERREPPPILFAYLGRRSCRFVRNRAGAVPLTGFLCVYPRAGTGLDADTLWARLNAPEVIERLAWVGKSYGAGAIKVEPRALERLPLPVELFAPPSATLAGVQLRLMQERAPYDLPTVPP